MSAGESRLSEIGVTQFEHVFEIRSPPTLAFVPAGKIAVVGHDDQVISPCQVGSFNGQSARLTIGTKPATITWGAEIRAVASITNVGLPEIHGHISLLDGKSRYAFASGKQRPLYGFRLNPDT